MSDFAKVGLVMGYVTLIGTWCVVTDDPRSTGIGILTVFAVWIISALAGLASLFIKEKKA